MSQTAITLAFEQHLADLQMGGQPVVPDEFVLAHVPGLDLTAPIDRAAGLPPAGQIVHRQPVDQRGKVNANGVAYSIIMDTRVGDFTFNTMYLVHKASGLVAMVVHKAAEDKLKNQGNQPGNSLVKSMLMEYQGAAEATNTQVNADTWQIDFSARLLGLDRDIQQQAHDHYGDAAFIADGFAVRPGQGVNEFMVAAGLGYIAGLRTELAAEQSVTVSQRPATLYADVYHAGTLLSDWHTQVTIRASSTLLTDYVDEAGYPHYVTPLATLAANGAVTDLRGRGGLWWHEQRPQAHTKEQVGLNKLENWSWSHSYTDTTGGATKYASGKAVADGYNAAKSYTDTSIASLVDTAPGTLDTLNELAAALGDDPNFATTMTTELAKKLNAVDAVIAGTATNKVVKRDEYADIHARAFRSWYPTANPTVNFIMTQIDQGQNNFIRPTTTEQFRSAVTDPYYQSIATSQFAPWNANRTYKTGETCTTLVNGELKVWEMYAGPNLTCTNKDPNDPANRHAGWLSTTAPFWWIEYGNRPGTPHFWLAETAPEYGVMELALDLPTAVYWRLARQYPHLVNDVAGTINTGEIRGEFLRVWDNGRGIDSGRTLGSWQKATLVGGYDDNDVGSDVSVLRGKQAKDFGEDIANPSDYPVLGAHWITGTLNYNAGTSSSWINSFYGATRPRNIARAMFIEI